MNDAGLVISRCELTAQSGATKPGRCLGLVHVCVQSWPPLASGAGACRGWSHPGVGVSSWTPLPAGAAPQLQVSRMGILQLFHGKGSLLGSGWAFSKGRDVWKHRARIKAGSSLINPPFPPEPGFCSRLCLVLHRNLECSLIPSGSLQHILECTSV